MNVSIICVVSFFGKDCEPKEYERRYKFVSFCSLPRTVNVNTTMLIRSLGRTVNVSTTMLYFVLLGKERSQHS